MKLTLLGATYDCTSVTRTGNDSLKAMAYLPDEDGNVSDTPSPVEFGGISDITLLKITSDDGSKYTAADLAIDAKRT